MWQQQIFSVQRLIITILSYKLFDLVFNLTLEVIIAKIQGVCDY